MFKVNNKDTRTTPLACWEVFHSVATCLVDFTTFFNTMKWLEVPYNFESHGPLKLSFINIRGLRCYFVSCDPLRKSILLTSLLYVKQTWKTLFTSAISL